MSRLRFDLHAVGVLAPGLASHDDLRAACRRGQPPAAGPLILPSPSTLPANERRRASAVVRLALACIEQALPSSPFPVESMRSVFASDEGTGETCQQVLNSLTTTRQVLPLLFSNSVHNAPAGYFSIAFRNRQSASVVSLGLESFASGLLCAVSDAVVLGQPVLLVCYDSPMAPPLEELLSITQHTATAWILSAPAASGREPALGSLEIELGHAGDTKPTPLPDWLPVAWRDHGSARALAALGLLEGEPGGVQRLTLGGLMLSLRRMDRGAT